MREPTLIERGEISIADLDIASRLRPVSDTAVESLKQSIEELGLQYEIIVRKVKRSGKLVLIAGGHRVAAFKALGREFIPAKVYDCTDDWAALFEIDDNLAHAELDPLELAVFLARRKQVYEKAFPEAKRGAAGNAARHGVLTDDLSVSSFAETAAEKMNCSTRKVFRLLAAGTKLGGDEVRQLREAPNKISMSDLEAIAKCNETVERYDLCKALGSGNFKSASDYLKSKKQPGAAVASPVEQQLSKMAEAWLRGSKEARRRFARRFGDELSELLAEEECSGDVVAFRAHGREA